MALAREHLRVVIDTSVFINALLAKSKGKSSENPCVRILNLFDANQFLLMANSQILDEYSRKINDREKIWVDPELGSEYINKVREKASFGRILVEPQIYLTRDPKDNLFFRSENCLFADYLITTDLDFNEAIDDLPKLGSKMKIVSPGEFCEYYDNRKK